MTTSRPEGSSKAVTLFNDRAKIVSEREWMRRYEKLRYDGLTLTEGLLLDVVEAPYSLMVSSLVMLYKRATGQIKGFHKGAGGNTLVSGAALAAMAETDINISLMPALTRKTWALASHVFDQMPDQSAQVAGPKPA